MPCGDGKGPNGAGRGLGRGGRGARGGRGGGCGLRRQAAVNTLLRQGEEQPAADQTPKEASTDR